MNAVRLYIFLLDATEPSKLDSLTSEDIDKYRRQWCELRQSSMLDKNQELVCDERIQLILAELGFRRSEAAQTKRHQQILRWTIVAAIAAIIAAMAALLALLR
jgi:hypothetical protein